MWTEKILTTVNSQNSNCYFPCIPLPINFYIATQRCLLLGRKVLTNIDSILKSRDITLPTKVHLVNTTVSPVVIYGCESWTIKKAER